MENKETEQRGVTERIKSFEDALKETGRPDVPEFLEVPEDLRPYFQAQYKAIVIAEALNEGWKADHKQVEQMRWLPWFAAPGSSFSLSTASCVSLNPRGGCAARLCLKNDELAMYTGRQFIDIWKDLIFK